MDNIMLDLETLDVRPTGVIVSLGAVWFGDGRTGATFYGVFDLEDQVRYGRTMNPSTLRWWLKQTPEARAVFNAPPTRSSQVLADFVDFLGEGTRYCKVWGNGADFDNVMLGSLYETYGVPRPWNYGNNRCFRTLKNIGIAQGVIQPDRTGTHHNALDDAIYQAEWANAIFDKLNRK
jgi:hypothetical protein